MIAPITLRVRHDIPEAFATHARAVVRRWEGERAADEDRRIAGMSDEELLAMLASEAEK